ncbi:hypothetical protein [Mycolicibacterium phlei]|jgi:hypothetical protein|uniref:hypothetical protein n=1 Tax=Mycolicibacterium phlei TaxID=1771 RepID=UPI00025AEE0C|nr:hypothetical protein [Mycolicibacterium phlei]EID14880.1 hypothetical protein MPHLEI_09474 [Mycolicibacterium phlei RIVM601174]MBF4191708.1 hypothetical protein [Mycolicibacterium phlei]
MSRKSDGTGVGGLIFAIFILIAMIPKEVWIALGVVAGLGVLIALISWVAKKHEQYVAAKEARELAEQKERTRRERQHRIETLGKDNAALVESALAAIDELSETEAARTGWLGDIDFSADIAAVTANFEKAHSLRQVIGELSALRNPSEDDRRILAEAKETASELESTALQRINMIGQCAEEARLIDRSLQEEREESRTAEQRAQLHAKLSAMLYGVEAAPRTTPQSTGADSVMARVQAYRDIKNQISVSYPRHDSASQVDTRRVRCFKCGHVQKVLATATVLPCIECGARMKLKLPSNRRRAC